MANNPASEQPKTTPEDMSMRDAWTYRRSFMINQPERRELMALWGRHVPRQAAADFAEHIRTFADGVESGEIELNFCETSIGVVAAGALSPCDPAPRDPLWHLQPRGVGSQGQDVIASGRHFVTFGATYREARNAAADALSRWDSLEMHPESSGWPRKPWILFRALQDAIRVVAPQDVQDMIEYEFANRKGAMRDSETE